MKDEKNKQRKLVSLKQKRCSPSRKMSLYKYTGEFEGKGS